jgi:beta-lactamase regulating signal transducer with metallopeptidase domain
MSAEVFLSATANGVYQGMLIAALVGIILRSFRTNAATRHAIWFGTLLLVAALIPAHLLLAGRHHSGSAPAADSLAAVMTGYASGPSLAASTMSLPIDNTIVQDPQWNEWDGDSTDDSPSCMVAMPPDEPAVGEAASDGGIKMMGSEEPPPQPVPAVSKPQSRNLEAAVTLPHSICLGLVSIVTLVAMIRGGLLAMRLRHIRRVKTSSSAPGQGLQSLFDRLRRSLGVRRKVRLSISSTHPTAVVLGFVNPAVLLPAEMNEQTNDGEVEDVLRHELAHVQRWDDWGNLAQQLVQSALFFHPAVWWISAKLALEREIACDDHVLAASGQPRAYALTLANVASRMIQCRPLLAPGVSNNNSQLQKRITMILNTHRDRSPLLAKSRLGFLATATALLAVLALAAGPRLVLAQAPPPPAPPAPVAVEAQPAALPDQAGDETGPRSKPEASDDAAPAAASVAATPASVPAPHTAAVVADAPVPPVAAVAPVASVEEVDSAPEVEDIVPDSPEPPHARSLRKGSVEERLDRIERTLEKLQARMDRSINRHVDSFSRDKSLPHGSWSFSADDLGLNRVAEEVKRAAEEAQRAAETGQRQAEQAQRMAEAGQRQAEQVQRAAEAGQRQAEQVMHDMQIKKFDFERLDKLAVDGKGSLTELQALRSARESLNKEMGTLDRQIQRLEQDLSRLKKEARKDRSDDSDDAPKAKSTERN